MVSTRLANEPPPSSPSELVIASVRQHRRLDGLLDRIRLLSEIGDSGASCVDRMIHAEQDRGKVTLAFLAAGVTGLTPCPAASLEQCAEILGWNSVLQASQTVLYMAACREAGRDSGVTGMGLFRRSLLSAVAARTLGQGMRMPESDSFSLGLLHDIGILGISAWKKIDYAEWLESDGGPDWAVERDIFSIDHTQAGLAILIYRGFKPSVCEAAAFHHGPLERISVPARLAACSTTLARNPEDELLQVHLARILGISDHSAVEAAERVRLARVGLSRLLR